MKFPTIMKKFGSKVIEGSPFMWSCFGPNAYSVVFGTDGDTHAPSGSVTFDLLTHDVYEISVLDGGAEPFAADAKITAHLWVEPKYWKKYLAENKKRGYDYQIIIDDSRYDIINNLPATLKFIKEKFGE